MASPLPTASRKQNTIACSTLVKHPDEVRREYQGRKDDEERTADLLRVMPKMYIFAVDGIQDGCTRVTFKPNVAYQEQSYQDRILHAAGGLSADPSE